MLHLPQSPTLGYGAVLEEYAAAEVLPPFDTEQISLPLPLSRNKEKNTLAFSFAGIISAMERTLKRHNPRYRFEAPPLSLQRAISRAFQTTAVAHIIDKTRLAIKSLEFPIHGLVVSGGVGSNQYLRQQ